ncbi:MAG TPA: glycosyl hydrolase, partial [Gemmatimonadaceae bacterium]
MNRSLLCSLVALATSIGAQAPRPADVSAYDPSRFAAMRYRLIGPARGGRVTTVSGVARDPLTYYFGSTGGGVWKTSDGGISWKDLSAQAFASASIGAMDVASSDPNVIYVGTGSAGIRSNVSIGKGIYKSTDAGQTWHFSGLKDAGQIGRLIVHPTNPDVAYAAVLGNPFAASPERGIFRTSDGGATWEKVLYLSDTTGASDVELQP